MLPIFDGLRDVTLASVTTRMLLAVLCGGLIGIERAYNCLLYTSPSPRD